MADSIRIAATTATASGLTATAATATVPRGERLRSGLFAGDKGLDMILKGPYELEYMENHRRSAFHIRKVQTALKIVIPEMPGVTQQQIDDITQWQVTREHDLDADRWTYNFQGLAGLGQDGIVGSETIRRLDQLLNAIGRYDVRPGKERAIHNESAWNRVGAWTRFSGRTFFELIANQAAVNELENGDLPNAIALELSGQGVDVQLSPTVEIEIPGRRWKHTVTSTRTIDGQSLTSTQVFLIELHLGIGADAADSDRELRLVVYFASYYLRNIPTEPQTDTAAALETERDVRIGDQPLQYGQRLKIKSIRPNGWCYVNTESGVEGYVETSLLWTNSQMCDPAATLHRVQLDETIEQIIDRVYGPFDSTTPPDQRDLDRRFYANVILYVNNPGGGATKTLEKLNPATGLYNESADVPAGVYLQANGGAWDLETIWDEIQSEASISIRKTQDFAHRTWAGVEQDLAGKFGGWDVWNQITIKDNFNLWLPSPEHAKSLKVYVDTGTLTGGIHASLKNRARQAFDTVKSGLNDLWPPGMGVKMDATIGATFGIPIAVDLDQNLYVWRDSGDSPDQFNLKVLKRGVISVGLDVGVGAGAFLGFGKTPKRFKAENDKEKLGIGAELGASVQAGVRVMLFQEFEFPAHEDLAFASFLVAMHQSTAAPASPGTNTPGNASLAFPLTVTDAIVLALKFFNIDPNDYVTSMKLQGGLYGGGRFLGYAGLRYGDSSTPPQGWTNGNYKESFSKGDGTILFFLADLLAVSVGASIDGEMCAGLEYKVTDPTDGSDKFLLDPESGNRIPKRIEAYAYAEAKIGAGVALPILSRLLAMLPIPTNLGAGGKVGGVWNYHPANFETTSTAEHKFDSFRVGLYQTGGETDIYDGSSTESIVWFNPSAIVGSGADPFSASPTSLSSLTNMFDGVESKLRFGLNGMTSFRKSLHLFVDKMKTLSVLINDDGKQKWGLIFGAYLDLQFTLPTDELSNIASAVFADYQAKHGDAPLDPDSLADYLSGAVNHLTAVTRTGVPPKDRSVLVDEIYKSLAKQKAALHVEIGGGVGAGAKLGAAAKIRGRIYMGAAVLGHIDLSLADAFDVIRIAMGQRVDVKNKILVTPLKLIDQFTANN